MRRKPDLEDDKLIACLATNYNINAISTRFLQVGHDLDAFVYECVATTEISYFVKIRAGAIHLPGLLVPRLLIEHGVPNILAPLRTRTQALWCSIDNYSVIVYPFIRGENSMVAGLSADQWREFGATLHAVHSGGFASMLHGLVPTEMFSIPSAQLVRRLSIKIKGTGYRSPAAAQLASFWAVSARLIEHLVVRAEALGKQLQSTQFDNVLCHADIHAANIMVSEGRQIYLVDWDGPLLAPRERDLLFVVGSRIARHVEPHEEELFFDGYGVVDVNMSALTYYRYERVIEDIGEIAKRVLLDDILSEEMKAEEAKLFYSLFRPGQIVEATVEADQELVL